MSELHVVATIPAAPDRVEDIRAALETLVEATRREEGCLGYDLFESASAPGVFVTVERWTGQDALDAHLGTPHIAAAMAAADGALAGDIAIHPLVPLVAG
ncbi:putative quinol monooxygenase [Phycicoccus sonneratiae]|uniref:Antibiotic biosynthesis monooxygenase n=1 Tax=Phycicoccus sonneratiae TaxID=2807628 RepID=A0ABS2CNU8_9MICO|nr:putative quinol monooxygenase [Phycicoccus sonneraticus]MBM6401554.1 antibiotic biosynthesis monooxygenase [Phycicoccus sonneraticus]